MTGAIPGLAIPGLGNVVDNDGDDDQAEMERQARRAVQINILSDLTAKAPTTAVRDCLRKYDASKQQWQIINALKQESKKVLVETLAYIGVPDMNKYLATALPDALFCRVQNLLPDTCHICKAKYCLKVQDRPIISCVKCGQGCHNECFLTLINKTEDDLIGLNQIEREALINPHGSIGLFYVCGHCQEDIVPQKHTGLMKHVAKNSKKQGVTPTIQNDQAATPVVASAATNGDANATILVDDSVATDEDAGILSPRRRVTIAANPIIIPNAEILLAPKSQIHSPPVPVCKHYKQARCKFGLAGKKEGIGSCPDAHPKPCKKLLEHGNRGPRGCNKGEACDLFHPQMCHRSLRDRTCINPSCRYMHVKGTKRSQVSIHVGDSTSINCGEDTGHQSSQSTHTPRQMNYNRAQPNPHHGNSSDQHNQDYFLDALMQMKEQILKEMDKKLQQLHAQTPTLHPIPQGYSLAHQYQQSLPNPYYPHNLYPMQRQMPPQALPNQGQMVMH